MMEAFIDQYGYAFVVVGTLFGGETVLAMAGFAAHRGYLLFPWVVVAGCIGNFTENQVWFLLGRRYGTIVIDRHPMWKTRIEKMDSWLTRYRVLAIIGVRFLAGFRTPGALAFGMSDIAVGSFMVLNLFGALLWALVVAVVGYFFGTAAQALMGDVKDLELLLVAFIGATGIAGWLYFRVRYRRIG
jgi:membrane protein DedA with SNARE-associated domain